MLGIQPGNPVSVKQMIQYPKMLAQYEQANYLESQ